ncbi:MAG: hypothetical protein WAZ94_08500 [Phycisphaerales bacterium]
MNIWNHNLVIERCRSFIRFLLWVALAVHAAMVAVFSVMMLFQLLRYAWAWAQRVLFDQPW